MKEFRKNQEGHFVCEECNRVYKKKDGLSKHINLNHGIFKYYDKWLKEEGDGICKICPEKTIFISLAKGYKNCCSKECSNKYAWKMCKEVNLKNMGLNTS